MRGGLAVAIAVLFEIGLALIVYGLLQWRTGRQR